MPQDAEFRQLLTDVLNEFRGGLKDHDDRIRKVELTMARYMGGIGVLTFIIGGALALFHR